MTEKSFWWNSHTLGDAVYAPYDMTQWAATEKWKFLPDPNLQGVIGGTLNSLEVTATIGANISINTGAALVNGRLYVSDAAVTFAVAGNSVFWLVGLQSTEAAQTIRSFCRGPYGSSALALASLIHVAGGVWEIPLAVVFTTAGGLVDSITDNRYYTIRPALKSVFVPAIAGYNTTDGTDIVRNNEIGVALINNKACSAFGSFAVPQDYLQSIEINAIGIADGSANVYVTTSVQHNEIGETYNTYADVVGYAAVTIVSQVNTIVGSVFPTSYVEGRIDVITFQTTRDGVHALDTHAGTLYISGWLVKYATLF